MKYLSIICAVTAVLVFGGAASAQVIIPPGTSQFNPPVPQPPPPPKIETPVVPQIDAPPAQTYQPPPRRSFSDRINSCLDEAAANGLGPGEREAYSRSCANSR
jgi:hypothetical protein